MTSTEAITDWLSSKGNFHRAFLSNSKVSVQAVFSQFDEFDADEKRKKILAVGTETALFKTYCRDLREGGMHFPTQNAEVTRLLLADLKKRLRNGKDYTKNMEITFLIDSSCLLDVCNFIIILIVGVIINRK
jgi:hypothetical protein